jgi:hypothetical protein
VDPAGDLVDAGKDRHAVIDPLLRPGSDWRNCGRQSQRDGQRSGPPVAFFSKYHRDAALQFAISLLIKS